MKNVKSTYGHFLNNFCNLFQINSLSSFLWHDLEKIHIKNKRIEIIKPNNVHTIEVPSRNKSMPRYIGLREKRNRPSVTSKSFQD